MISLPVHPLGRISLSLIENCKSVILWRHATTSNDRRAELLSRVIVKWPSR